MQKLRRKVNYRLSISDDELWTLSKWFSTVDLGRRFDCTSSNISQRLRRIAKKRESAKTSLKEISTDTNFEVNLSIKDMLEKASMILLNEKERNTLSIREKIDIGKGIAAIGKIRADCEETLLKHDAMDAVVSILTDILKNLDPKLADQFTNKVLTDERLSFLLNKK